MADEDDQTNTRSAPTRKKIIKKKGLPPISPRENSDTGSTRPTVRPVKKKKKTGQPEKISSKESENENEDKPTPRRRRKRSPSQTKSNDGEMLATTDFTTIPKKKKKKPKPATTDEENQNQSADVPQTQQEAQGSKTSLIIKDQTAGKKTGKKKKKVRKATAGDDYGDSPWAEDLKTIQDDIICGGREAEDELDQDAGKKNIRKTFVTAPILRSQPLDKIFIETSSRFKGQNKRTVSKQHAEKTMPEEVTKEVLRMTTSDFALSTNKVFRVIALFLHGLSSGLAVWQVVTVFTLASFSSDDFLEHYYQIAMPLQGSLYFLLAICTVSVCDRFDIGHPNRRFVLQALTLQNGTVCVVFCLAALVLNVVAIRYEDRMSLHKDFQDLYSGNNMRAEEIDTFRSINTARSVFILLSWFVLSFTPNTDRLGMSLKSGKTGLGLEMDQVSSA